MEHCSSKADHHKICLKSSLGPTISFSLNTKDVTPGLNVQKSIISNFAQSELETAMSWMLMLSQPGSPACCWPRPPLSCILHTPPDTTLSSPHNQIS